MGQEQGATAGSTDTTTYTTGICLHIGLRVVLLVFTVMLFNGKIAMQQQLASQIPQLTPQVTMGSNRLVIVLATFLALGSC